jgi:DNA-binding Xre family transcriptional regulator
MHSLRRDKAIGAETLEKMRKGAGHIDARSIESLCGYLDCQPGDIMEHVEDMPIGVKGDGANAASI